MRKVLPQRAVLVPENAVKVFGGIIYDVYHWQQILYDGSTKTFEMLKRPDTVKIIAIDGNDLVVLEQEQPNQGVFYDIPGGIHDHNEEDELTAAQRELLEETGMVFNKWKLVSVTQPHNKIEQFVYIFVATNLASTKAQSLDAGEKVTVKRVSLKEAKDLLAPPKGRYLPKEIEYANTIQDLFKLPEYS